MFEDQLLLLYFVYNRHRHIFIVDPAVNRCIYAAWTIIDMDFILASPNT
jgi:hypothetical protein